MENVDLCQKLLAQIIATLDGRRLRFMEVCGTHTVALFRTGIRQILPENIVHLSGPGCPVCVTHDSEIAAFLELAKREDVVIATFGDLLRVPGPSGMTLKSARAEGARVEIVYSPLDAVRLAQKHTDVTVVFLGIGFETTAPTVAGSIARAKELGLHNFCVFSLHKLVPPILRTIVEEQDCMVDAFLLPGHVSTIIGLAPYAFLAEEFALPSVVGGFEALDLLLALALLVRDYVEKKAVVRNAYPRAVFDQGNPKATAMIEEFFEPSEALWRGLGSIPNSGLILRDKYAEFDARVRFGITLSEVQSPPGCRCGDVLKGVLSPASCPLFGKRCTPREPVGPCMVSTEGSCAAWYNYYYTSH